MKIRKSPRAALPVLALCLAAAAAMLVSPAASGQGGRAAQDISQALHSFDSLALSPAALLKDARANGRVRLSTPRGDFDLEVEPFDIRGDNYRAVATGAGGSETELPRSPSNSWRGRVAGTKETFVRLVLDGERVQGIIITPAETFFIEPARSLTAAAAAGEHVFYAESEVKATGGECSVITLADKVAGRDPRLGAGSASAAATTGAPDPEALFGPMPEVEIATDADFEYFLANGSSTANTNADILNVMTQVDAIYEAQLGMKIRVVFQNVWTTSADPYTLSNADTPTQEGILGEFAEHWNATRTGVQRDLAHLFTGKDISGPTIGIAYIAAACAFPTSSYGLSQSKFSGVMQQRVAVTAHELGHNFGADHTNASTPNCDSTNSLMNGNVQPNAPSNNFCQFSRDEITGYVMSLGDCLTRLVQPGCGYSLTNDTTPFFGPAGGSGVIGVNTTQANCAWGAAEAANWIDAPLSGVGPGGGPFSVAPNTNSGPREAAVDVAGALMIVRQAASPTCLGARLTPGETVAGALADSDCRVAQPGHPQAPLDLYTFTGRAGQRVRIEMLAAVKASDTPPNQDPPDAALDCFLYLFGPDASIIGGNDDRSSNPHNTDSVVAGPGGFFTLPSTGVYSIAATAFGDNDNGSYTLRLLDNSAANSFSFSAASYGVDEGVGAGGLGTDGVGFRVVTVTRTGADMTGTATVDYATSDGTASRQKDYTQALGTLVFGPNETSKSFTVFVDDDAFAEGAETVQLTLSNPVGAGLGAAPSATLTINSANDASSAPSPVREASFNTAFFVRQHYLDFLSREPDASGMQFWTGNVEECGADAQCREVKRINVSGAFFRSIEFQNTGFLVYRMYKAAYGDATSPGVAGTVPVIKLNEFLPDTQRIGQGVIVNQGDWERQLEDNKQALALEFVLRPRFTGAFPLSMSAAAFVDQLNANAGGVLTQGERDALVAQVDSSADVAAARAAALRRVAEDADLQAAETNRAFVLMQYFGYLRRNPDDAPEPGLNYGGWRFWLDKLNEFNGDFVAAEMVKAFITSDEYINRFGQ